MLARLNFFFFFVVGWVVGKGCGEIGGSSIVPTEHSFKWTYVVSK